MPFSLSRRVHVAVVAADFSSVFHLHPDDDNAAGGASSSSSGATRAAIDANATELNVSLAFPSAGAYRASVAFAVWADRCVRFSRQQ